MRKLADITSKALGTFKSETSIVEPQSVAASDLR